MGAGAQQATFATRSLRVTWPTDGHPGRQHLLCNGHLVGMGPPTRCSAPKTWSTGGRSDTCSSSSPHGRDPRSGPRNFSTATAKTYAYYTARRKTDGTSISASPRPTNPKAPIPTTAQSSSTAPRRSTHSCWKTPASCISRGKPTAGSKADRTAGLQNLGRRAAHGGEPLHAAARRQTAGHGRAALAENRRLLLHRLLHKRLLRPWERLRRGGRPLEKTCGAYERYAGNPILHGGGDVQSIGHGTITTTPDGRMFYLCHAYLAGEEFLSGTPADVAADRPGR